MLTVRSEESETGIQLFDSNGNPVGLSKAAGEKVLKFKKAKTNKTKWLSLTSRSVKYFALFVQAVRETALSRAALFGATAAVPSLLVLLLQRSVS